MHFIIIRAKSNSIFENSALLFAQTQFKNTSMHFTNTESTKCYNWNIAIVFANMKTWIIINISNIVNSSFQIVNSKQWWIAFIQNYGLHLSIKFGKKHFRNATRLMVFEIKIILIYFISSSLNHWIEFSKLINICLTFRIHSTNIFIIFFYFRRHHTKRKSSMILMLCWLLIK